MPYEKVNKDLVMDFTVGMRAARKTVQTNLKVGMCENLVKEANRTGIPTASKMIEAILKLYFNTDEDGNKLAEKED